MIAGLPESLIPLQGLENLSQYRCQYPSCNHEFSQKAVACNHVHCDHLNVTLACLYCSFNNTPKMHWYSASTWEHHTHKHAQDNLPLHPNDPAFFQQFADVDAIPFTSMFTPDLPQTDVIWKMAQAAKPFLKEESNKSTFPSSEEYVPSPPEVPKHCTKQGLVKSSKNKRKLLNKKLKMSMSKLLEPTSVTVLTLCVSSHTQECTCMLP